MLKNKLDEIDHQILQILIKNSRTPFTDIAKELIVSAGTIHIRVKKMEDMGVIKGSTLVIDYEKLNYTFIAYVGLFVDNTSSFSEIIEAVNKIPEVTVSHLTTGKFAIFCKIRAKNTKNAKQIIFNLDKIKGVVRTETSISLEEVINDKQRLMKLIFEEFKQ
ncbi:MAG TPA: Lrp/AsnC family transcriptional regulator [Flavobacteriaceae bacterium]|nr:Lrp/AsnC family transcriptional regulator [Flavobacteriaceae bacterium]